MNKKAFTLIEVLAVIIILGIITAIVAPITLSIIDRAKQSKYDQQINEIKQAAVMYVSELSTTNAELSQVGVPHVVSLETLADLGYIKLPIENPLTGETFNDVCFSVAITRQSNDTFTYDIDSSGSCEATLVLNGSNPDTVACAATGNYSDPKAVVTDKFNPTAPDISATTILALKNAGSHTLTYSYTNSVAITTTTTRTVNITNTSNPTITIAGGVTTMSVGINKSFTAPSATATDTCEGDLTSSISKVSTVNTAVAGSYTVTYTVTNKGGRTDTKVVNVTVYATPTLTVLGSSPATVACASTGNYTDPGADVNDTYDLGAANVYAAARSLKTAGVYTLNYSYTNALTLTANASRTLNITNSNTPVVTIAGGITTMSFEKDSSFTVPTATATDTCEGSIAVTVVSTVVPTVGGTYTVTYTATNAGGIVGTKILTVYVYVTPPIPPITLDDIANTVSGMATTMEYSYQGGAYTTYSAATFATLDFEGTKTLLVRYKASGINPYGPAKTLNFTLAPVIVRLTSTTTSTWTVPALVTKIDLFLVGGGGGGGYGDPATGGGGGYTNTILNITVTPGQSISYKVGKGGIGKLDNGSGPTSGGETTAHGYTAAGGIRGTDGGNGGSGGGGYTAFFGRDGGEDGSDGGGDSNGIGQGTTTRAFGDPAGELFSGGGGGVQIYSNDFRSGANGSGSAGCGGRATISYGSQGNSAPGQDGIVLVRYYR